MRNATAPGYTVPTPPSYAPSVPISVYRELAAEVQAAQSMLEFLRNQNQQLVQQNQQLRQELDKVVQAAMQMRQVADSYEPVSWHPMSEPSRINTAVPIEPSRPVFVEPSRPAPIARSAPRSAAPKVEPPEPAVLPAEALFTEEDARPRPSKPERSVDLGGVWLAIAIFLIIVSAFGAGFLIVRPFLPTRPS